MLIACELPPGAEAYSTPTKPPTDHESATKKSSAGRSTSTVEEPETPLTLVVLSDSPTSLEIAFCPCSPKRNAGVRRTRTTVSEGARTSMSAARAGKASAIPPKARVDTKAFRSKLRLGMIAVLACSVPHSCQPRRALFLLRSGPFALTVAKSHAPKRHTQYGRTATPSSP